MPQDVEAFRKAIEAPDPPEIPRAIPVRRKDEPQSGFEFFVEELFGTPGKALETVGRLSGVVPTVEALLGLVETPGQAILGGAKGALKEGTVGGALAGAVQQVEAGFHAPLGSALLTEDQERGILQAEDVLKEAGVGELGRLEFRKLISRTPTSITGREILGFAADFALPSGAAGAGKKLLTGVAKRARGTELIRPTKPAKKIKVDPEVEKAKLVTRLEAEKAQKEARVVIRKEAAQRVEQAIKAEGQLDKATVSRAIGIRTGRELPQLEQPSGIRKADVAADRELLGMSDIPSPEKQDFFKWQRAAIDQGIPERANALVDEVLEKPRGFTKVESAGVATRLQELKLEYEATARRAISLEKKAKGKPLLDPEVQEAAADVVRLEAEMDKLHHALRASGTENARNLVAQKFTINRTFDLATSIVRARGMKGAKLTAKERAKVVRATVKLQKNETALQTGLVKARAKEAAETIKVGSSRFRKMTPEARQRSMDDMVERAKRLIKEGCSVIG